MFASYCIRISIPASLSLFTWPRTAFPYTCLCRLHPYSTDCSSLPCWGISSGSAHWDSTRHFREHQSRRIACAADVTPCLAADKETEVQPFLRDDGIQFVHVCRTVPSGIGKVCNLFIGRNVVTAAILSRAYRIVIVIQGDGLADSRLEFLSAFAISCATPYPMA